MAGRKITRKDIEDLRGASRAVIDATTGVTDVVEQMHGTIQRVAPPLGPEGPERTGGVTGLVYRTVRGTARLVGGLLDAGLGALASRMDGMDGEDDKRVSPPRDDLVAALNGIYGDYLAETLNPLAIETQLRHRGRRLRPAQGETIPGGQHVLVQMHGLCVNERCWARRGQDRVAELGERLGFTVLHLRYNTGRAIPDNGASVAAVLEDMQSAWPSELGSLTLVAHSMGGLVARSAIDAGETAGHRWRADLTRLVTLGTPHLGSPLERAGSLVDLALRVSPYSAPIGRLARRRSAGIRDLREGRVAVDEDGEPRPLPLPADVACYAAAGTLGETRTVVDDRLRGDGLVPVRSALGEDRRRPDRSLAFAEDGRWVGVRLGHLDLLDHPDVLAQLERWLSER